MWGWRQGHVRAVAEAHTVCWGVTSASVVRRVSGAIHGVTTVTPGGTRGHVDPLAEVRGPCRAVAGRLAGTVVRLFEVFSCPWRPPTLFSLLLPMARVPWPSLPTHLRQDKQGGPLIPCRYAAIGSLLLVCIAAIAAIEYVDRCER